MISGFIASKSQVHDARHAHRLLRQCPKKRRSDCYVVDKGYDSEAIHRLIREDLYADSFIPIRSWNTVFVGSIYRQEMTLYFDDVRYRKRQLVENMFSVLKRKSSGDLKARIFANQKKEITGKMIVCNIHATFTSSYNFLSLRFSIEYIYLFIDYYHTIVLMEEKTISLDFGKINSNQRYYLGWGLVVIVFALSLIIQSLFRDFWISSGVFFILLAICLIILGLIKPIMPLISLLGGLNLLVGIAIIGILVAHIDPLMVGGLIILVTGISLLVFKGSKSNV